MAQVLSCILSSYIVTHILLGVFYRLNIQGVQEVSPDFILITIVSLNKLHVDSPGSNMCSYDD